LLWSCQYTECNVGGKYGVYRRLTFITWLILFWIKYWAIAITNKRIVVFRVSSFIPAVKESVDSFPRDIDLDVSEALWGRLMLGEKRYWVNRVYLEDIYEANEVDSAAIIKEKLRNQNKGNQKDEQDEASTFEIQTNR